MEKLMKFFPLLPEEKDTTKLIWAIVFYVLVPSPVAVIIATILGMILGITMILLPLAPVVGGALGLAGTVYSVMGIVFAIMKYTGTKIK